MTLNLFVLKTFQKTLYNVLKTLALIDHYFNIVTILLKHKYIGKCRNFTPMSPYAEASTTKRDLILKRRLSLTSCHGRSTFFVRF